MSYLDRNHFLGRVVQELDRFRSIAVEDKAVLYDHIRTALEESEMEAAV